MANDMIDLTDRVAVVTGAASGIGRAIATTLGRAGAAVVVADLTETPREGGETTVAAVRALGARAEFRACDVTDSGSVAALMESTLATMDGLDIVVNNAGVLVEGTVLETSDDQWRRQLAVNVDGTFYGCREAIRVMFERGRGGKIVNITSISGFRGNPGFAAYCASKGAVVNLTRQLGLDWAPHGINVNAVAPGFVETQMTAIYDADVRAALAGQTPRGRWARPQDVADAVLFLASPLSDHVCGENLVVDGGWLVGTPVAA
jgi:3-oxoacyl-[acyl-carrier protein] reductase/meso-butanediol dehydrogenase/(S,S)-butanediol dehydrogenase/diacetyl reductase